MGGLPVTVFPWPWQYFSVSVCKDHTWAILPAATLGWHTVPKAWA